ncbi:MAG: ATP-binding cassette domain-containing protein [Kiritimatiellae bacterium]|nr:ATP-binding cassette domain-containing protein [Kiritimatiellia bacterium]
MKELLHIKGKRGTCIENVDWRIFEGENWAIFGPNGSGKSLLCSLAAGEAGMAFCEAMECADTLEGNVALASFRQQQALQQANGYLQARYHSSADDDAQTVRGFLSFNAVHGINPFAVGKHHAKARRAFKARFSSIAEALGLAALLPRDLISLSNGEMRRVLVARAILLEPKLLVLDDPMAGLDPSRRETMKKLLDSLASEGIAIAMACRSEDELPSCINRRLHLGGNAHISPPDTPLQRATPPPPRDPSSPPVVEICHLTLKFGRRCLFKDFSWTVCEGERWVVRGENGCGKTTLFSLISGDNPLAYANDIRVFGARRKPGAALWRIRKRIAGVSPEEQGFLDPGISAIDTVLSGRYTIHGEIRPVSRTERKKAGELLRKFGIGKEAASMQFGAMPSGKQRIVLLARALAAEPDLLLLDEPCLNLDEPARAEFFAQLAGYIAAHPRLAVVIIAHRADHIPSSFQYTLDL